MNEKNNIKQPCSIFSTRISLHSLSFHIRCLMTKLTVCQNKGLSYFYTKVANLPKWPQGNDCHSLWVEKNSRHLVDGHFFYLTMSSHWLESSWGRSYGSAKIGFQDKLWRKSWKWLSVGKLAQVALGKCLQYLMG